MFTFLYHAIFSYPVYNLLLIAMAILVGLALKTQEGRFGCTCTTILVWHCALCPDALTTVRVYVTFEVILETVCEPLTATEPMLGEMEALAVFGVVHVRVDAPPFCTIVGFAESVHEGAPGGV